MRLLSLFLCVFVVCACTAHKEIERPDTEDPSAAIERASAELGNPLLANKGDLDAVNVRVNSSEELEKIDNGSNEELIWTDADHPDAEIPELTEVFEHKRQGSGWQANMLQAIKLARRRELPLIIWFHDSVISPRSNALGSEYLTTREFLDWADNRAVLLRLDSGASQDDKQPDNARYHADDLKTLQRRYGLSRKPSFAIVTPQGKIAARIDGFDGMLSGFILELKAGVSKANEEMARYKQKLLDRGFRNWFSADRNRHIFAKLMRFDPDRGVVYLKESGGRVTRTKLSHFCQDDVEYLQNLPASKRGKKIPSDDPTEPYASQE